MTESEAIKELHKIRPRGGIIPQKRAEAIDVAINALEIILRKYEENKDDVCEWEHDIQFEFAKSKCGFMDTRRIEFMQLKYCPYCEKKIKVV